MRVLLGCLACLVAVASSVTAQSRIDAGVSAGVVRITGQRSEDAVSGVLEYEASSWLSLYAIPAVLHVTDSTSKGSFSSSGLGDLPVVAALSRTFLTPWSPTLGVAVVAVLPTGNASCGLGNGQTAAGMDLGLGLSPGRAHLSADASRSVSGASAQSSLNAPKATTLRFEGGYDVSPRWTWMASGGGDVRTADWTHALSPLIGGGLRPTLPARPAALGGALHRGVGVAGVPVRAGRRERSRDRHVRVVARDVGGRAGLLREEDVVGHRPKRERHGFANVHGKRARCERQGGRGSYRVARGGRCGGAVAGATACHRQQ